MIASLAPDQLRPLDRVLVNGSWRRLHRANRINRGPATGTWRIELIIDDDPHGDLLVIERGPDARLTVDRSGS